MKNVFWPSSLRLYLLRLSEFIISADIRPSHTPVLTGREQQCPPWHDHMASPQSASWTQVTGLLLTSFRFSPLGHTDREPVQKIYMSFSKRTIMHFLLPLQKEIKQSKPADRCTYLTQDSSSHYYKSRLPFLIPDTQYCPCRV